MAINDPHIKVLKFNDHSKLITRSRELRSEFENLISTLYDVNFSEETLDKWWPHATIQEEVKI